MHTSHDTSTIGRFAPRSRTTKTPTFAYDIHSGVLVRQLLVALGGGTGRDQLPFRHGQPPDDCAFGWPAALSWLQAILAARVDAAQVVSPYSGQELQRVLLARASGLSVVPCVFAVRLPSVAQAQPGQSRLPHRKSEDTRRWHRDRLEMPA